MTNSRNTQSTIKSFEVIESLEKLEIQNAIAKNTYLKEMQNYKIFPTISDLEKLQIGHQIKINGKELSIKYLTRILTDDKYFDYIQRYFKEEIKNFSITCLIENDIGKSLRYSKVNIVKGLEQLILSGDIPLSPKISERFEELKSLISFDHFLKINQNEQYEITIDKKDYKIPVKEIISIMFMPNSDFYDLCDDNNKKSIHGIPKEHFIYACYDYFLQNNIINYYLLPDEVVKKFHDIEELKAIDLQAINSYLEIKDTLYKQITIDDSLRNRILSGMPTDVTPLEKAIYIYIKMCKLLTYDDEYFAVNQKGQATIKHREIKYISQINLENNELVCYEFNLIYSKFLSKLGLNFESNYKSILGEYYGDGHVNLQFRYDKFLVKADSLVSILEGDLVHAKLNRPLIGLQCINMNEKTKKQFEEYMTKMYNLIIEQSKKDHDEKGEISSFDDLIKEYESATENIQNIDLEEKIDILTSKINTINLSSIDSLSYILEISKIIFSQQERLDNVSAIIIRNNQPSTEKVASSCLIFTLNPNGFDTLPSNNSYFFYTPGKPVIPITKDELEDKFQKGVLEYIGDDEHKIPGIEFDDKLSKYASLL